MAILKSRPAVNVRHVLVVDDEPMLFELFRDHVAGALECDVIGVSRLDEARKVLARESVDLLITDVVLPDGSGLSLLPELHKRQPDASALVMTGVPNLDTAIEAIRGGAVDFMRKPFSAEHLMDSVRKALAAQRIRYRKEHRLEKLRAAFRKLNAGRKLVNKKVDLLCGDLIGAYAQMAKNLDTLRLQQGFREFVGQATTLEQLLCHTMDWLLRQIGYCNIGLWLASGDEELQLGAYMKYTIPGERELTAALEENLLRMVVRRGFVRLRGPEVKPHLSQTELKYLANQDIVAINCSYLGDTLGAMVLFRDSKTPFSDEDVTAIKTVTPLFALALTHAVHQGEQQTPEDGEPKPKHDPADWWKTGENPPF